MPSLPEGPPAPSGVVATAIDTSWGKPAPNQTSFSDALHAQPCGPTGDGADVETNSRKNRTDTPVDGFHDAEFSALAVLPMVLGAPLKRNLWTQTQKDVLAPDEGVAVRVVGYLVAIKVEDKHRSAHGESTNCHWTEANEVDWHMALVVSAGQGEKDCVVVETTPHIAGTIRSGRRSDSTHGSTPQSGPNQRVGDVHPDHPDHLGKFRQTHWEVHPAIRMRFSRMTGSGLIWTTCRSVRGGRSS